MVKRNNISHITKRRSLSRLSRKVCMSIMLLAAMAFVSNSAFAQVIINQTALTSGTFTITETGTVTITIVGADGGDGSNTTGGQGATVTATFNVNANDVIRYVVGEAGDNNNGSSAGGGGSTGVYINNVLVMVAGGGGGGDNSNGAIGLGGSTGTAGDDGTGGGPGVGGTNGGGGQETQNAVAAGGGGGISGAGGAGDGGGGGQSDQTTSVLTELLSIAAGGGGNGTGSAGGQGFTGGGGADSNYSGGGGGYSGGGGAGANGSAGGGGSFVDASATSSNFTAGGDGTGNENDGSILATFTETTPPPAPTNVSATALVGGNISISFDDVDETGSGVASYSIRRATVTGGPYTEVGTETDDESPNYTFVDDTPVDGTTYFYIVVAIDAATNESINSAEVTDTADGTAPTLSVAEINGATLTLDYDEALDGASVPANGDFTVNVNSSPVTVSGVSVSNDSVYITLATPVIFGDAVTLDYAIGSNPIQDATGNQSAALTAQAVTNNTPDNDPPPTPTTVNAVSLAGGNIDVLFDDMDETGSGVVSYSVRRSTTQGGPYTEVGTVTDNESAVYTFNDTGLSDGTTYFYVVVSIDGSGNESPLSAEVFATSDGSAPALSSATVDATTLVLNYNENLETGSVPNTTDFNLVINSNPATVSNVSISSDSVILTITPEVVIGDVVTISYIAGVNPVLDVPGNQAANLLGQAVNNITAGDDIPGPPQTLSATPLTGGPIRIDFSDVNSSVGIDEYSIQRSTSQGGPYTEITTVTDDNSPTYSYTDNSVVNGTTYYYVITSTDDNATESIPSSEISATSDATPPVFQVATLDEATLQIDYNEALDTASEPVPGDFVVRVNGSPRTVSNVDVSGNRVILTISPAAVSGDNITFDYTPGTNPVQDVAGNDAIAIVNSPVTNTTFNNQNFGPDPCPIVNGQDVAWACFDGTFGGTSLTAAVGGLVIANVSAVGAQTTFSPNALQQWASGSFLGDQFNGPQSNPSGSSGDATSFDITIPSGVPSDALILSLNRLSPNGGATSYTLEAFDSGDVPIPLNGWLTGQGTDGGVCTNTVNLVYTNGNNTIEFQPTVSGNPSCSISSTPIWFRITSTNVARIEIRKVVSGSDNIFFGLGLVADFGDAPNSFGTNYSGLGTPPAFHILDNNGTNSVFFGGGVDGDGNGAANPTSTGDDGESTGIGSGDDEDAISVLADLTTADTNYDVTLVCTDGANVGGWIDFDQSGNFDSNEFASSICSAGSVDLSWSGITGLITGSTYARFRIATNIADIANPTGVALDGEVEDYQLSIIPPPQPDLALFKTVDRPTPIQGDTVNFTIKLKNEGPDNATGIQVTDQLPTGVTFISSTADQGTYFNGTSIWNIGDVAAGDSVELVIEARVDQGTLGQTIVNNASITAFNETDPDLSDNAASAGITVVQEATDIGVTMIVDESQPLEGQQIIYTITVTNLGPRNATALSIIDQIPSGLTFVSANPNVGTYNNSTGIWDIGDLDDQAVASMVLTVSVDVGTEGSTIANTAAVNAVDQSDPVAANDAASVDITVATPGIPGSCTEITSLVFENSTLQSGTAGQVGAVYLFPNVAPGVNAEMEIVTNNNAILVNIDQTDSGVGTNFQPQIEANDKSQPDGFFDFEVRFVDATTGNPRFLTFTASGVDVDGDPDGAREFVGFQRLTSFTVETATDLIVGSEGIFTTFASAQPVVVPGIDPNNTNNLAYTTYTNEPVFRIRAGIKDPTTTGFLQRLFAFNFDPCIINNFTNPTSSDIVDVSVTKDVDNLVPAVGATITYTLNAKNEQGNSVGDVEITDQLPAGVTFVSATPSQGTYNNVTGIWDIGTLVGQQAVTLTITATVDNGTEGNTITNTATVTDTGGDSANPTGNDGNGNNNTASAVIAVFDPGSSLNCTEPPLFSFTNPSLEQGVPLQVNAIYRFSNIASGLDALVKVVGITNATLDDIDDDGIADSPANFSPFFTALGGGNDGFIDFEITIVQTGTNTPVRQDFALTGLDIDGTAGGGGTLRDYLGFAQNQGNTVQAGNNLNITTTTGGFQVFESAVTTDGNGTFDINHFAYITYKYTSTFQLRTGSFTTNGFSDDRLVDIDFRQCLNLEFTNPVTTTRNADIDVQKVVDNANPLQDETINFTITVTNNGPEEATELAINEALPTGLTLVQATPSQGTYNQLTKLWEIGTLPSLGVVTLGVEATVDIGVVSDSLTNQAFVQGLNQADPVVANDSSSVIVTVSIPISGTVFEDITGDAIEDGDTDFDDASGDQQAKENVEVHLFRDGGDGNADGSDDTFVETVLTNSTGDYTFQVGEAGDYWIVVDSKTGDLSDGNTWAEQVYAPIGGICEDGTGSTTTRTTAGVCYGGRRGNQSDNISTTPVAADLANAEHVAGITVASSSVTDIDFGFSFNVVTDTRDGDDDVSANRSIQGSLRQFIENANNITGANTMRFVPAVPTNASGSGGNWWSVTLNSQLPAITDALTTIDGTAYNLNTPLVVLDNNSGSVGSGGSVGIDQLSVNTFTRKEFEINLNDAGADAFRINSSGAIVVREIATYNGERGIRISSVSNGLIEDNLFGTRADGTDPTGSSRLSRGIGFNSGGTVDVLIQDNYVAHATNSGIRSDNTNATIEIFRNEIFQNAIITTGADGIEGVGIWTIEQNLIHSNGNNNSEPDRGGSGIELGNNLNATSGNTIRNNTIRDNTVTGVNVLNTVSNSLIEENIINNNGTRYASGSNKLGAGVKLSLPDGGDINGVRITRNSFFDNHGISVDIVVTYGPGISGQADGVNPNDGAVQSSSTAPNTALDYPIFTLATLDGTTLHVEGFVGTTGTPLSGTYTIEVYKADDDGNNDGLIEVGGSLIRPHGEGRDLLGVITTNSDGTFSEDIILNGSVPVAINDRITALAFDATNNTSEFSSNQRVVPTGVTISGFVYHDDNHNQNKEGGEPGIPNVTIVLFNEAENNCTSLLTDATGFYEFTNVLNGNYQLIEAFGQNVPAPDVCIPAEADPTNHVSTTPNTRPVVVNNLPANQDFGDFEGIRIEGNVFEDNGIGGATANDGVRNGGELGLTSTTVQALTTGGAQLAQTSTPASGDYVLFVPLSSAPTGTTIRVVETNISGFISTGGSAGTTGGTYAIATDDVTFTVTTGTFYTGVDFADVQSSRLLTDGQQTLLPGATGFFLHTFEAQTSGDVTFTTQSVNNPSGITWPTILYHDIGCDGSIDAGTDVILTPTTALSLVAGETVCLIYRVTVPQGVNNGATSTSTITATFDLINTSPIIQEVFNRTDLVNVSDTEAGFVLTKTVDQSQALPGTPLVYSINYINNGDTPITQIEIVDVIPSFTTFSSASCGTLPSGVTCNITAPAVGQAGTIKWNFTGSLSPGAGGIVTFTVIIDN